MQAGRTGFGLMLFSIIAITTLNYLVLGIPRIAHAGTNVIVTPTAIPELVLRKKICYKIFADSTGFKITDQTIESLDLEGVPYWEVRVKLQNIKNNLYASKEDITGALSQAIGSDLTSKYKDLILQYADLRTRVVDGPVYNSYNGNALTGHYTSFGTYTPGPCSEIYDYWEEESYQVFRLFSTSGRIDNVNYTAEVTYGKYFGETPSVNVDIVQLPPDFRSLIWDRGSIQIHLAIEEIERGKALTTLSIGRDQKVLQEGSVKLGNIIVFQNLKDMERLTGNVYDYGYYALKVKNKINPHVCGGVKGYTLREDPVKLEVSLTGPDGLPLTNFSLNDGVVLDLCVNGFTTPGYGFVVQGIQLSQAFEEEKQPAEYNDVFLLDSVYKKTGHVHQPITFHACQPGQAISTVYLEQRIAELGGTNASFWVGEKHRHPTYYVDYGNGEREELKDCVWTHTFNQGGEYKLSVLVEWELWGVNVSGQTVFIRKEQREELARKLVVIEDIHLGKFAASPAVDFYNVNELFIGFVPEHQSYKTTEATAGCPPGFAGKFLFTATLGAKSGSPPL